MIFDTKIASPSVHTSSEWRQFVKVFIATLVIGLATTYLLILVLDPYDSGRFANYPVRGVVDENPRTANVSRGRDPQFNSVVIGHSRGQLLDPKRLSKETRLSFVQLTVPGTTPREQLALLRWFIEHHSQIGAVILVADTVWCTQNPALPLMNPFPFWLYSENNFEYLINVLRTQALGRAWRRTLLWLGLRKRSSPDGYWDYEAGRNWAFRPDIPINFVPASLQATDPKLSFPAIELLHHALSKLDRDVPLVIVRPPAFFTDLPASGDPNANLISQCKGALAEVTSQRLRGAFLDFEVDGEIARNPENFMDVAHYRAPVARMIEARVGAALSSRPVPEAKGN